MTYLLPLHRPDGSPVWVNPDHLRTLNPEQPRENDDCHAWLGMDRSGLYVRETPDEILALLGLPGEKPERCSGCNALASEAPEYECLVPNCPMIAEALERR